MPSRRWCAPAVGLTAAALAVAPLTTAAAQAATVTNSAAADSTVTDTVGTSTSWAGYQTESGSGLTSVSATWTVPTVACGSSATAGNAFVGLEDGSGHDVQVGITADCSGGGESVMPWELADGSPFLLAVDLPAPGDSVTLSVTYSAELSSSDYVMYATSVTDNTQGWNEWIGTGASGYDLDDHADVGVDSVTYQDTSLPPGLGPGWLSSITEPLAQFSPVNFTDVTVNGSALGTYSTDQNNLVSSSGATLAATSALSGTGSFTVTDEG
jgi:hypothetical protein